MDPHMQVKIEEVLTLIRPALRMDGGGIELAGFDADTGVVRVKMQGACVGCPMSQVTLKIAVEAALREAIPSVTEVIAV